MALLDVRSDSKRASHARLVLALDELAQCEHEWVPLALYATLRGIDTLSGARRSLFRLKRTLAREGVPLEVTTKNSTVMARFATQAIQELIALHLRRARRLVEILDARREGREPDLEGLARESELVTPETIVREFRERKKSHSWIARAHGIGIKRVRRILASAGPTARPEARRLEGQRSEAVVKRALDAADRFASLEEIAAILGCSRRTAIRFAQRHGRALIRGRPLGIMVTRQVKGNEVSPFSRAVALLSDE